MSNENNDIEIPPNLVTPQSGISNRHSRTKGDTINGNVYKPELKSFVEGFFRNMGAQIVDNNGLLVVSNISRDFELLAGKKGPYRMSFDRAEENAEFVTKGSTLLNSIMSYMGERGQTTLIKLDFERDYKTEFKHYLSLKNSVIQDFTKNAEFRSFPRFSVVTTLQYLNEKEQITNNICLENGKVKDFSLEKYKYQEGKKNEVSTIKLKEDYEAAKVELKKLIKNRVEDTANNLSDKLNREIERVRRHYTKQRGEFEQMVLKLKEQIKNLEIQLKKAKIEELNQIQTKIARINESILQAEKSDVLKNL